MIVDLMRSAERAFPAVSDPARVTALRVWFCKFDSLAALADMHQLRILVIAGYPDEDLAPLVGLERLEYLHIVHLPRISDLIPLGELTALRTVRLQTLPSWDSSGRVTEVASLAPLGALPKLEHLELFGVRSRSRSLADLEPSSSLRTVRVSKYPKDETARYRAVAGTSDAFAPKSGIGDWA